MTTELEWVRTRDGRSLRVERHTPEGPVRSSTGGVAPTVVVESGMGASRHMWGATLALVDEWATTVSYDRSGLGDSPADPAPRRLDRLAADLVDVLDHLGVGPFVLVGHSWGGPIIRRAAEQVPDRIAGLVLVDVTEETCELFFSATSERQTRMMLPLLPLIARTGALRIPVKQLARSLPASSAARMRQVDGTVAAARAQQAELRHHIEDLQGLLDEPPLLPDIPVTYISGTEEVRMERGQRPALVVAHRRAAASLRQGRHVTADRSGHYVPFTEPALVAEEIRRIAVPDA